MYICMVKENHTHIIHITYLKTQIFLLFFFLNFSFIYIYIYNLYSATQEEQQHCLKHLCHETVNVLITIAPVIPIYNNNLLIFTLSSTLKAVSLTSNTFNYSFRGS